MPEVTAQDLRNVIAHAIAPTIDIHRESRAAMEGSGYERPLGPPTYDEINDFLFSNSLLDEETVEHLWDPGLLGHAAKTALATQEWLEEFQEDIASWAQNNSWLAADRPWVDWIISRTPEASRLWKPDRDIRPGWLDAAPTALIIAADLLTHGRLLTEMPWRRFEEMIGALLEAEGWEVEVTRPSRDGGIDVVAVTHHPTLGDVKSIWQAKRYGPTNRVSLSEVRELSGIVERERVTRGMIVTTSCLTRDAIKWIRQDQYRLGYKDGPQVASWLRRVVLGEPGRAG